MKEPILITGCARSGTSMVAGIINMCGAFGGKMTGPNKNNAKGMFENAQIRDVLVKPYLREIGVDPKGQYPLPDVNKLKIPVDWAERVRKIMIDEGYKNGHWMYKGAKMCLIYPIWHYAFPNAKWVIVRRKDEDIVRSCLNTGFMTAFKYEHKVKAVGAKDETDAWFWWVRQHNKLFVEMIEKGLNCKQVHPERMIRGDYSQIHEMLEWLGLEWNSEIPNFIEPKLWKARQYAKL
jgi:hypothetical protein